MAYNELIKNFSRIRDYMREFYVYGFRSRDDYNKKSSRSYDNEKRRIESYLGDYMSFRQTASGKNVFISIDSRNTTHNPLYLAFKAKSFTDGDITLHFILFDILYDNNIYMTLHEITEKIDNEYLSVFSEPMMFDESTVRKKLKEYIELGLVESLKQGNKVFYSRCEDVNISEWCDAVEFFSEVGMLGVVGSFLLDKPYEYSNVFSFKHHYINYALESEILLKLLDGISKRCIMEISQYTKKNPKVSKHKIVPLKIFISANSGRHYLLGYSTERHHIISLRIDYIVSAESIEPYVYFEEMRLKLNQLQEHMWGVSCNSKTRQLEHVEFSIYIGKGEEYIYHRLEREKRCGTVTMTNENTAVFSADVYDTSELIPWIRTFICRIVSLNFSNRTVENLFKRDIEYMYRLYDISGDDENAV